MAEKQPYYSELQTEMRNEKTVNIDKMSPLQIAQLINEEDKTVPNAVEKALPEIAEAIEAAATVLKNGGRIFYVGAGTSGRLGVLDASECPPTYGVSPELVQGIIAGGKEAAFRAVEKAEDDADSVVSQLKEKEFSANDICIGISASGSAACVCGALEYAKSLGAKTVSVSCATLSKSAQISDISIIIRKTLPLSL